MAAGPPPKDPSTRRARNKHSTFTVLHPQDEADVEVPTLPPRQDKKRWLVKTLAFWTDLWHSPMAPEYTEADIHGLYDLAVLVDDFNRAESVHERVKLSAEIRMIRQAYGLSPMDRRRLQWQIDQGDAAEVRTRARAAEKRPKPVGRDDEGGDPRTMLA